MSTCITPAESIAFESVSEFAPTGAVPRSTAPS